jgi:hypothetical protein
MRGICKTSRGRKSGKCGYDTGFAVFAVEVPWMLSFGRMLCLASSLRYSKNIG